MLKKVAIFLGIIGVTALFCAVPALAAPTTKPDEASITVVNNLTGTPDTVTISSVSADDIIRVYTAPAGGAAVGATIAAGTTATVYVDQLGAAGGSAYVTVTTSGYDESDRAKVTVDPETKTLAPVAGDIAVQNNVADICDVITVNNVKSGDVIRAYPNSVSPIALGATVSSGTTATLYISQLGLAGGSVYVTVQNDKALESGRVMLPYSSEISPSLTADDVTIQNNFAGTDDTVTVTAAEIGDFITIYKAAAGPDRWTEPPVEVTASNLISGKLTIPITQLGKDAGKLYITIRKPNKAESKRVPFAIPAEPVTAQLTAGQVKVTNNYGKADTVDVYGLKPGDKIIVYSASTGSTTLGTGTVAAGNDTVQIGVGDLTASGGTIYVTITSSVSNESNRTAIKYGVENATDPLPAGSVKVNNIFGDNDTADISNVQKDDIIKIYANSTGGPAIGNGTAAGTSVSIPLTGALSSSGGTVYVTIQSGGAGESKRTAVSYSKEPVATAPAAKDVDVTNNYGASDTVTVKNLPTGAKIKVYLTASGGTAYGPGYESSGTATVTLDAGLLSAAGNKLYVTATWSNANESPRTPVTYLKEETTDALPVDSIAVANNYNMEDTITISGVADKWVIKVFTSTSASAKPVAEVTATGVTATITLPKDDGLLAGGGKIYVTVKMPQANESSRTTVTYSSEKTTAPAAKAVTVINNYAGTDDTVTVTGAKKDALINIYKTAGGKETWKDSVPVPASGSVTIPIPQLGQQAGKIFVTVTEVNKAESTRTTVPFSSEPVTPAPDVHNITVENNFNNDDVVVVANLTAGQIVTLYSTQTGSTALATAKATDTTLTFYLDNGLLAANGGRVFVAVTGDKQLESLRTGVTYTSETSVAPKASNILVVNYPGTQYDTVTIVGLTAGDTVTVYDAATGGNVLVSQTVPGKGSTITLKTNLPNNSNKIYVTITSEGKAESKRTTVTYQAE